MRCGCVSTGPATGAGARRSLPLGEVMGAILPAPISGKLLGAAFSHSFLIKPFHGMCGRATVKSENRKLARRARGNRRRPVLLQTLSARDFDELARAFPRWGLRFQQLGRGPFRGHLQSLRLGGAQVFQTAVNRRVHIEGCPPRQLWLLSRPGRQRKRRLGRPAPEGGPGPGVRPAPASGLAAPRRAQRVGLTSSGAAAGGGMDARCARGRRPRFLRGRHG
jgi:hypothetical protein